jgi:heme-degrading monooxygenase HmoA
VPVINAQPGFKAVYLVMDQATGNGHSLTVWDSEADGLAYERSGTYQSLVDKVRPYFAFAPSLTTYEVSVHAAAPARVTS